MTLDRSPLEQKLWELIRHLTPGQVELLSDMAIAFQHEVSQERDHDSDIVTDDFADYFRNRLILHHATSEEKFKKKTFEHAFRASVAHAGRRAEITSQATHAGADVIIEGGERWSLKTEAAQRLSRTKITVSKFSEARWIRDCSTVHDFCRETTTRVGHHLSQYDRIATLRAFDRPGSMVRYDFVEIPVSLLRRMATLRPEHFTARTGAGGSSANVLDGSGRVAFTVVLDGSVEKVTIRGLRSDLCRVHASWEVPVVKLDED